MTIGRSRLATSEQIDLATNLRLTLSVEPKDNITILAVAESIAALLSSSDPAGEQTMIMEEPSGGKISLAIPAAFAKPELGLTQLLNLLSVPAEYDHCRALIFENLELPRGHLARYGGPRFGVTGLRDAFGVPEGPILGAIFKPRQLPDLDQALESVVELASANLDFLVDDELMVDTVHAPFEVRVGRVVDALTLRRRRGTASTLFIANVTARPSQACEFAQIASSLGAGGIVTNPIVAGFGAVEDLAAAGLDLPIFATNMGTALLAKGPGQGRFAGLTEPLIGKLTRLAGADAIHGGIDKSDWYASTPSQGTINVLNGPLPEIKQAFRIIAGGLDVVRMIDNWPLDSEPVIFEAGSSIFSHPGGVRAGADAMRTAWELACEHMTSEEASRDVTMAAIALASEQDAALAGALKASKWSPSAEVRAAMRKLPLRTGIFKRIWNRVSR